MFGSNDFCYPFSILFFTVTDFPQAEPPHHHRQHRMQHQRKLCLNTFQVPSNDTLPQTTAFLPVSFCLSMVCISNYFGSGHMTHHHRKKHSESIPIVHVQTDCPTHEYEKTSSAASVAQAGSACWPKTTFENIQFVNKIKGGVHTFDS